jgi:diaminopimelate decarboxylase
VTGDAAARASSGDAPLNLGLLPRTATVDAAGRLGIDGVDVDALAREHGTPLYVYSETELRARAAEYREAFGPAAVSYAGKAFLCGAMARLVADEGLHLDVATGGELQLALHAGFPAARIVFHGNNKSDAELALALERDVGRIVADSFDELDRIDALVSAHNTAPARVLVRVTPGVEAHTHEYIATGADDSKFGFTVSNGTARDAALRVVKSEAMHFAGFHCHIGSQILVLESFARAAAVVAGLAADVVRATDVAVPEINLGGGLGVPYTVDELDAPSIADFGRETRANFADACATFALDPAPALTVERSEEHTSELQSR